MALSTCRKQFSSVPLVLTMPLLPPVNQLLSPKPKGMHGQRKCLNCLPSPICCPSAAMLCSPCRCTVNHMMHPGLVPQCGFKAPVGVQRLCACVPPHEGTPEKLGLSCEFFIISPLCGQPLPFLLNLYSQSLKAGKCQIIYMSNLLELSLVAA